MLNRNGLSVQKDNSVSSLMEEKCRAAVFRAITRDWSGHWHRPLIEAK